MSATIQDKKGVILIVDDTPINIQILSKTLSKEYDVRIATNGKKALEIANSEDKPDLILLDVMMPEMDGYEVCKELKENTLTADIPVIFVSAKSEVEDEAKGFSLGGVDYIAKPFHLVIVKARVQTHLRLRKQAKLLEEYAFLDPLTQISNRRKFDAQLGVEWGRAIRSKTPISLCMVDIDYFKLYNDALGHGEGDVCLQQVATTIHKHSARGGELAARYGGEEFMIMLPNCDAQEAYQSAKNIRQAVESLEMPHPSSSVSPFVSVSVGCASVYPSESAISVKEFIKLTDDALYRAKESGRNRVAT